MKISLQERLPPWWKDVLGEIFKKHRLAHRVDIMTIYPHHQHNYQHHRPHHQNTSILVIFVNPEWWSRNLLRKTLPPISLVEQHWAMFKLLQKIEMINNLHLSLLFHQKEKIEKRIAISTFSKYGNCNIIYWHSLDELLIWHLDHCLFAGNRLLHSHAISVLKDKTKKTFNKNKQKIGIRWKRDWASAKSA